MNRRAVVQANAIRQKRQHYRGCFLVVEGPDDARFFRQIIDLDACRIHVAGKKKKVADVVAILEHDAFPGVVGVVDADFDHIEGYRSSDNVIVLETVDLEALLIRSAALDRVLVELGSRDKIRKLGRDVRDVLIGAAVWVGCLRLHSERTKLRLKFRNLTYSKFIDKESLRIDRGAFLREVMNRSRRNDLSHEELRQEIVAIHASLEDHWLVCKGKDMVEVLEYGLRKALGTKRERKVDSKVLQRSLRLAFERRDLEKSQLGRDLRDWEARNPGYSVLSQG